jgi:hypothetical protein
VRGLYLSEDGGQSWGRQSEIDDVPVRELQFALEGAVLYATTPDGVVLLHNP